jgi:hypothetical protein
VAVNTPTLPTPSDNQDGTGAVATVSGSSEGTTNTVYYAPYGSTSWTNGGDREGDGTVDFSITTIGKYWAYIHSESVDGVSVSTVVSFRVTDIGGLEVLPARAYPRLRGPWATIYLTADDPWAYESMQLIVKRLGRHRDG